MANPAGGTGEALIFAIVTGIGGAAVVGADVVTALAERGRGDPAEVASA